MPDPASRRGPVDLPHLAFATAIAGWAVWYCYDAYTAEARIENLIMILPAALAAVALYLVVLAGCLRPVLAARAPLARGIALKIAGAMALLVAYAICAPLYGFDVASFAYVLATLLLLGERCVLALVLIPVLFCALAIYCFETLLAIPLPLLLVPGDPS